MKKKLWTAETLFGAIVSQLKEKGLYPDSLDYASPTSERHEFKNMDFDIVGMTEFGGCEGIYLTVYANYGRNKHVCLGTFKTLGDSREDFYTMTKLQADFTIEGREFVMDHEDHFNWEGYDIQLFKDEKRIMWKCVKSVSFVETVFENVLRRGVDFDYALLINNETGKEQKVEKCELLMC